MQLISPYLYLWFDTMYWDSEEEKEEGKKRRTNLIAHLSSSPLSLSLFKRFEKPKVETRNQKNKSWELVYVLSNDAANSTHNK